jgi:hypothetical protein
MNAGTLRQKDWQPPVAQAFFAGECSLPKQTATEGASYPERAANLSGKKDSGACCKAMLPCYREPLPSEILP